MSEFDWDYEENLFLEKARGIGFEDVVFHIKNGDVLDVIRHPNKDQYPNQNIIPRFGEDPEKSRQRRHSLSDPDFKYVAQARQREIERSGLTTR